MDYDEEDTSTVEDVLTPSNETQILLTGLLVLTFALLALIIFNAITKTWNSEIYNYCSYGHFLAGYCHVLCVLVGVEDATVLNFIILTVPLTTVSMSSVTFFKFHLRGDIGKLYGVKENVFFVLTCASICDSYQELFNALGFETEEHVKLALRLNIVLVVLSIPGFVFAVLIKSLFGKSSSMPWPVSIFILVHLFVFLASDCVLVWYEIESSFNISSSLTVASVLLVTRLLVEVLWMAVSFSFIQKLMLTSDC